MNLEVPNGFRLAAVHCGIKKASTRPDITLALSDRPCTAAAVYTRNQIVAAPVLLDRQRTPSSSIRAVVINSGNANACTGDQGMRNALSMTERVATACGISAQDVLVMSTGIIGEQLPMDRVMQGIDSAAAALGATPDHLMGAACGIMTTDTRPKLGARRVSTARGEFHVVGFAKGAGMIGPQMATMLSLLLTDAPLAPHDAQSVLARVADVTYNCVSVEGHTSTNDTAILLANGAAGARPADGCLQGADLEAFEQSLRSLCTDLARAIADDGEGATHLITIDVQESRSTSEARAIAAAIANSPLVKTAIAGADPNWGRILSAAGYAGFTLDPQRISLWLNDHLLYQQGAPVTFDPTRVSDDLRSQRETSIRLTLGVGTESARFWTCDLTAEYVHINADYHT